MATTENNLLIVGDVVRPLVASVDGLIWTDRLYEVVAVKFLRSGNTLAVVPLGKLIHHFLSHPTGFMKETTEKQDFYGSNRFMMVRNCRFCLTGRPARNDYISYYGDRHRVALKIIQLIKSRKLDMRNLAVNDLVDSYYSFCQGICDCPDQWKDFEYLDESFCQEAQPDDSADDSSDDSPDELPASEDQDWNDDGEDPDPVSINSREVSCEFEVGDVVECLDPILREKGTPDFQLEKGKHYEVVGLELRQMISKKEDYCIRINPLNAPRGWNGQYYKAYRFKMVTSVNLRKKLLLPIPPFAGDIVRAISLIPKKWIEGDPDSFYLTESSYYKVLKTALISYGEVPKDLRDGRVPYSLNVVRLWRNLTDDDASPSASWNGTWVNEWFFTQDETTNPPNPSPNPSSDFKKRNVELKNKITELNKKIDQISENPRLFEPDVPAEYAKIGDIVQAKLNLEKIRSEHKDGKLLVIEGLHDSDFYEVVDLIRHPARGFPILNVSYRVTPVTELRGGFWKRKSREKTSVFGGTFHNSIFFDVIEKIGAPASSQRKTRSKDRPSRTSDVHPIEDASLPDHPDKPIPEIPSRPPTVPKFVGVASKGHPGRVVGIVGHKKSVVKEAIEKMNPANWFGHDFHGH
jgi:hypothetical protein